MSTRTRRRIVGLVFACGAIGLGALPATAQPRAGEMVPDPAEFFKQFFAAPKEEEERLLAGIEVSPEEERRIGEQAVGAFLDDLKRRRIRVVAAGKEVKYLQDLVDTLRPMMENAKRYPNIKIYLVLTDRCDARSFPGGILVFTHGLLEDAESEAAVIGIAGHELAHLDRGHHLHRIRRMKLAEQTFSGNFRGMTPQQFFNSGMVLGRMFMQPFRAEDEAEADEVGATWAYRAGYDPREMGKLLLSLRDRPPGPMDFMPQFLRSHPAPEARHKAILEQYAKLQKAEPRHKLYIGRPNLRKRIARSRREFPE